VLPWERKAKQDLGGYRWAAVGLEFGVCVVLFFLGGRALDGNLGTDPWWTVIGSLVGVAAGMYLLIRTALRGQIPSDEDQPPQPPGQGEGPVEGRSATEGMDEPPSVPR
jgi:F0F1-type ATP synthase assembly protein I